MPSNVVASYMIAEPHWAQPIAPSEFHFHGPAFPDPRIDALEAWIAELERRLAEKRRAKRPAKLKGTR